MHVKSNAQSLQLVLKTKKVTTKVMSMLIRAADIWTCEAVELGEWMLSSRELYFAPCRYVCIYIN